MRGCGCCLFVNILHCSLLIECKATLSDVQFEADCLIQWVPVIIYGWLVQHRINLAAPLVLLFFGEYSLAENSPFFERNLIIHVTIVGYGQIGMSQACQVLLLDLYPGNGASIIANVCDSFFHYQYIVSMLTHNLYCSTRIILYVHGMACVRRFILFFLSLPFCSGAVSNSRCWNSCSRSTHESHKDWPHFGAYDLLCECSFGR